MKRESAAELVENILGSNDVQEELMINRSRLKALVDAGKLSPIKILKRESLFWKPEVDLLKKEMMKDSRTNLYKQDALVKAAIWKIEGMGTVYIKGAILTARIQCEEKLERLMKELMNVPPESSKYKFICEEIVSVVSDLKKLAVDAAEYEKSLQEAKDEDK